MNGTTTSRGRTAVVSHAGQEQPVMKAREGKVSILDQVALRLEMDPMDLQRVLKATVFKGASNEEFAALLVVANAYGLNPLTKELYAFPAKGGGIVPVVSIDGWIRITNEHPQFRGVEFSDISDENGDLIGVECTMWRNDRDMPVRIIEYLEECRQNTDPWKKMPARMNRHKAYIQCSRYTFGFSGLADETDASIMAREVSFAPPMPAIEDNSGPPPRRTHVARGEVEDHGSRIDRSLEELSPDRKSDHELSDHDSTPHVAQPKADEIIAKSKKIELLPDLDTLRKDTLADIEAMPEVMQATVHEALDQAEARLKGDK